MADGECPEVRQGHHEVRDVGDAVVGEVQDAELFHPGDLRRDFGETLVAEVEFPGVWRNHRDSLTLRCRTMEGSDVKQQDDDLARYG